MLRESFGDRAEYKLFVRGSKYEYSYQNPDVHLGMYKRWQKGKE